MDETDFIVRPGPIRDRGGRGRSFVGHALHAAARAGAPPGRIGGGLGRGRRGGLRLGLDASLRTTGRRVIVKARVVRHAGARFRAAPLAVHIGYLKRDGVDRTGAAGAMFDATGEADDRGFAARCESDRHHFRFIVSPEDAGELADLRAFTRDLMRAAEADLGGRLDWVAAAHWNTAHPHIHILVRGVDGAGADLVIPRDYIARGLRARAEALVALELGPRTAREIAAALERDATAERWTSLDTALDRAAREGRVDLRPGAGGIPADLRPALVGRAVALERLGLAEPAGVGTWRLAPERRSALDGLATRAEIVGRLRQVAPDRPAEELVLAGEIHPARVVGRLAARGLHDELSGEAYVIVDGLDGRIRHVRTPDLAATGDTPVGGLVELRPSDGGMRIVHRSDLRLEAQVTATGSAWLDRQLVAAHPEPLAFAGFGGEARWALAARAAHLLASELASEGPGGLRFTADLVVVLRARELAAEGARLQARTGLQFHPTQDGVVVGRYSRRLDLASGRFAVIEDGQGFWLAPWAQVLDRRLGQEVSGRMAGGRMTWDLGRGRELGL